jgi:hypothetical protein
LFGYRESRYEKEYFKTSAGFNSMFNILLAGSFFGTTFIDCSGQLGAIWI